MQHEISPTQLGWRFAVEEADGMKRFPKDPVRFNARTLLLSRSRTQTTGDPLFSHLAVIEFIKTPECPGTIFVAFNERIVPFLRAFLSQNAPSTRSTP